MLIPMYSWLAALYATLAALWCAECWLMRRSVLPVHLGCMLSLLAKCAEIATQYRYYRVLNEEGAVGEGFWVAKELSASLSQTTCCLAWRPSTNSRSGLGL